jgi:hypothetical protein
MNRVSSLAPAARLPAADRRRAFSFVLRAILGLSALLTIIAPFARL